MDDTLLKLILYACPTGELATQLDAYYARARAEVGPNAAHCYPPHITLTGFFHDVAHAIPAYTYALSTALAAAPRPAAIRVVGVMYEPHFHGLLIESPWLQNIARTFAHLADSPTRTDAIRLKDWLHLSLAYEFQPEHARPLQAIAQVMIDITASVGWELRFYERFGHDAWRCHDAWVLDAVI